MMPYRLVLADDHVLLRQGLKKILEGVREMEVMGEANDGLELLELLKGLAPHLVILDISMPRLRGIEAIQEIHTLYPHLKILVLTMHRDKEYLLAAISAGANGYILKEDADEQLFAAIAKIRQGKIYVSPKLADALTEEWAKTCRKEQRPVPEGERLTLREREVLKLAAEGKSSKTIADLLCISHRTVEHHRARIMAKLNGKRTVDLVKYAIAQGYV